MGHGQVMGSIAQDPRVTVMERTNLRHLRPEQLPEQVIAGGMGRVPCLFSSCTTGSCALHGQYTQQQLLCCVLVCLQLPTTYMHVLLLQLSNTQVSLVTLDLSFISVLKVMPALAAVMAPGVQLVVLIKPQFEAGRAQVGAGGLVKDPQVRGWCVVLGVVNAMLTG